MAILSIIISGFFINCNSWYFKPHLDNWSTVTNFQSFLDQLHIGTNPIETIIIGLANIFLAAIAGFLGQLPAPAGGAKTKTLTTSFKLGGKSMVIVPRYYKHASDFKSDWNRVCAADQHPEIELK